MPAYAPIPGEEDPKTVVLQFWQALSRCDFKAMEPFIAEDMVWRLMGCGFLPNQGVYEGRETIIRDLLGLAAVLYREDTFHLDIEAVYADGPTVIVEFVVNCINHKGRPYKDVHYCNVFTVAAGKITRVHEYMDSYKVKTIHFDD